MTSISPSLLPYYINGVNSPSQVSGDQSLVDQIDTQQNQNTQDDIFGPAASLNLSSSALDALNGSSLSGGNSTDNILNALTYSNFSGGSTGTDNTDALLSMLNDMGSNTTNAQSTTDPTDALLSMLDGSNASTTGSAPVVPTGTSGTSWDNAVLADGGPLPAFLAMVDSQMNLNPTQQQSLSNIAWSNMGITNTPDNVQMIATELQQAGI